MIRKMSLFIKTWHTFPPYYQPHANHPLEATETSFFLIRQVSDTNRRREVIKSHFPFCVPILGLKRVRWFDWDRWFIFIWCRGRSHMWSSLGVWYHLDQYGLACPSVHFKQAISMSPWPCTCDASPPSSLRQTGLIWTE